LSYRIQYELYRVNRSDSSRRSNCDTADGSSCEIVNCVNVRVSGINSLYPRRREVICRVIYPTRDTIYNTVMYRASVSPGSVQQIMPYLQ
jgi:hypothetical protein